LAQHRKSIIKAVLDRLDERMVLEQSRGKFHSYQDLYHTRKAYKEHALIFANWVRATHGIKRIEDLDEHILRHTMLTALAEQGWAPELLQERAGHASFQQTYQTYVHPSGEALRTAWEKTQAAVSLGSVSHERK
jgi:integrase